MVRRLKNAIQALIVGLFWAQRGEFLGLERFVHGADLIRGFKPIVWVYVVSV